MSDVFKANFFLGNRQKLKSLFTGSDPIVLSANGLIQRNGENTFPFRQDSSFWYLTGIDDPDILLIIDQDKEYLILPQRNTSQTIMEGALDTEKLSKLSGIKNIYTNSSGWKILSSRIKRSKRFASLAAPPTYVEHYGFYTNPARANLNEKIHSIIPDAKMYDLRAQMTAMRSIKQPVELECLQKAMDITCQTLKFIKANIEKYQYEHQIEADISYKYRLNGARGHGFSPIIAGGSNATIPHYFSNNTKLSNEDLVLIDTGAEVSNYTADISRTYSQAEPTKRQTAVYRAVLDVQNYALTQVKIGTTIPQLEDKVEKYMGEKLRELGLIKKNDKAHIRKYYPHLTSHYLGLDVHDIGDYDQPLAPNMVITVEPGIYIPEEGLGVRIEDDVLVTTKSPKIMSLLAPKQLW